MNRTNTGTSDCPWNCTINQAAPQTDIVSCFAVIGTVLAALAMAAVIISAVIGNVLVVVSVCRFERLRVTANFFIVSLAAADLLVAVLVMPFNASQEIAGRWLFGSIACDLFNANDVLFSTASLLHLCCISTDRYIAITDPFHYESRMSTRRVAVMLCCAWGASALLSHLPIQLGWYTTDEHADMDANVCTFIVNRIYCLVSSGISFWIPTIVMLFTYYRIFSEARRQEHQIHKLCCEAAAMSLKPVTQLAPPGGNGANQTERKRLQQQQQRKMRREHKAARTLGIIMGGFLCCWLPFFIWYITQTMCGTACSTPPLVVSTLFWVGYFNSALNPVIYAFFNRDFRYAFNRLLFRRLRCRRRRPQGPEADWLAGAPPSDSRSRNSHPSITGSVNNTPCLARTHTSYEAVK